MADLDLKRVIGLMVVVVIGLYLLSPLVSAATSAIYANTATQSQTFAGTTGTFTFLHTGVWNSSGQYSFTSNATGMTFAWATGVGWGTAAANATATLGSMNSGHTTVTVSYHYMQPVSNDTLLALIPLFDVIMILLVIVLECYVLINGLT